jgi:hypothetical protein
VIIIGPAIREILRRDKTMEKYVVIERYYDNGNCTIEKGIMREPIERKKELSNHDVYRSVFDTEKEANVYYQECLESGEF